MKCISCNCTAFKRMLHRTNPIGQPDGGWMCMPCIELHEPELAKNIKTEEDFSVIKKIESAINKKS